MSTETAFRLPDVGEGIAEAEILQWLVQPGDAVALDQPLLVVETDKAQVELPAPIAGKIMTLHAEVGTSVPVGDLLVTINAGGAEVGPTIAPNVPVAADGLPNPAAPAAERGTATPPVDAVRASPAVRRRAARLGIDLSALSGTGPDGRILATDLDAGQEPAAATTGSSDTGVSAEARAEPPHVTHQPTDEVVRLSGVRRRIADSMNEANAIPAITEWLQVDATNLLTAHASLQSTATERGVRLTVLPLLVMATVRALARQRSMNGTYDDATQTHVRRGDISVGIATATDDGLIVPVIRDADHLSLFDLCRAIDQSTSRARARTATPRELSGGSFTISNSGALGTTLGAPLIRPPEIGLVAFGRIQESVLAVDGEPVVRPVLPFIAATDHRINDGAHLARFVADIAEAVSNPYVLLAQEPGRSSWS